MLQRWGARGEGPWRGRPDLVESERSSGGWKAEQTPEELLLLLLPLPPPPPRGRSVMGPLSVQVADRLAVHTRCGGADQSLPGRLQRGGPSGVAAVL